MRVPMMPAVTGPMCRPMRISTCESSDATYEAQRDCRKGGEGGVRGGGGGESEGGWARLDSSAHSAPAT